ncbi:hypothetical protein [Verrucomicrobium sp. BvORR106]|uniref:hypothetical protein n=1 Tax=Verrucomicrobium sp. BvORR106 TaxID=1403819 RepID=UPI00056E0424|nr:hypothetical protein [Verrucomicrobium sp. BvORR106]
MAIQKIKRLAWIAMVLSTLGLVSVATLPYVIQKQISYKFGEFVSDESLAKIAAKAVTAELPVLIGGFLLALAGVVSAFGLFRCREWARKGWLAVCLIWVGIQVISGLPHVDMLSVVALAFRAGVLIYSLRVLMDHSVRGEFTKAKMQVKC